MSELYEFGPFFVDGDRRALLRDRTVVAVSNKAFEVLLVLIRDRHRVVEKEELLERVWPDTVVEENNLTVAISGLRKALGRTSAIAAISLLSPAGAIALPRMSESWPSAMTSPIKLPRGREK